MKKLFAIFGDPVCHSKSPLMHNLALNRLNIDGCYGRYLLKDAKKLREKIFSLGLAGINITVPHKEAAYKVCDELDEFAKRAKSVNTIVKKDNKLYGYNTDASGFLKAISKFEAKNILFLGAGGTARSTAVILRDNSYEVTILNRSASRLEMFSKDGFKTYTFKNFRPKKYDLVVNMTSAGLEDDNLPAPIGILKLVVPSSKACIDVIYGKETPFLKYAKSYGVETKDGSDMLLYQGVLALKYFLDDKYDFNQILPHMKIAFDFN